MIYFSEVDEVELVSAYESSKLVKAAVKTLKTDDMQKRGVRK